MVSADAGPDATTADDGVTTAHRYLIHQRIRAPLHQFNDLEIQGFTVSQIPWACGAGLLFKRELQAEGWIKAFTTFASDLAPILDVLSVLSQCAVYPSLASSHFVYRLDDNPDRELLLYATRDRSAVGMTIQNTTVADTQRIMGSATWDRDRVAFGFLRQANLTSTPVFRLAALLMAAEAFAGQTKITKECPGCGREYSYPGVARESLVAVLGEGLYKQLYSGSAIRHRLFHGGKVDEKKVIELQDQVHNQILLKYLRTTHSLTSVEEIAGAPRVPTYQYTSFFTKIEGEPDLLQLEKQAEGLSPIKEPTGY